MIPPSARRNLPGVTTAILTTPRLVLRPARADDLDAFHSILSDRRAMAYWSTPPHQSLAQTAEWLAAMRSIPAHEGEDFVIARDGVAIGKAGLWRFPEIGFILHPDQWGQGLAHEAVGAVVARAFEVHGLAAIVADVDPRNAASLRLLARLGFVETGRRSRSWLVGGVWCDSVDLRLARDGFARATPPNLSNLGLDPAARTA